MTSSTGRPKRIVLSGCTGFIGRELIPRLEALQVDLLLVGRDAGKVEALFPGRNVCEYASLAEAGREYDLLIHLAVLNNDSGATDEQFEAVNVDLALRTAEAAVAAGIPNFVHVSSFHALDVTRTDGYARSKRLRAR